MAAEISIRGGETPKLKVLQCKLSPRISCSALLTGGGVEVPEQNSKQVSKQEFFSGFPQCLPFFLFVWHC